MILFGDFLERLTGGKYEAVDNDPLYYSTEAFPEPKKILSFNAKTSQDTLVAERLRDSQLLFWDEYSILRFEVLSVRRYKGMVGKGTLISMVRI
jgi:hypothetical protein